MRRFCKESRWQEVLRHLHRETRFMCSESSLMVKDNQSRFKFPFLTKTSFKERIRRVISSSRLVMSLLCRDQSLKAGSISPWILALALTASWSAIDCAAQQLRVVPSLSVREQYDTNVFFTPKSQLPPGTKADD